MARSKVKRTWQYVCTKCGSVWLVDSTRTRSQQLEQVPIIRCRLKLKASGEHLSGSSGCGYENAIFDPQNTKDGAP